MAQTQNVDDNGTSIPQNALLDSAELVLDEETLEILGSSGEKESKEADSEVVEVETAETVVAAESDKTEQDALAAGWVSKADWVDRHGSEKGWKPATDFMDVRRNLMPLVQRENRELRARIDEMERKAAERDTKEANDRANFERSSLKLEIRQAREDQDWDKVEALTDKMLDLKVAEKTAPVAARPAAGAVDPAVQRAFVDFAARNEWVKTDPKLAKIFAIQLKGILEADPKIDTAEALEDTRDLVRRMYPEKFNGRRPAMAESGGESGVASSGRRSWADLKPEYKSAYDDKYFRMNPEVKRENLLRHMPADAFRN